MRFSPHWIRSKSVNACSRILTSLRLSVYICALNVVTSLCVLWRGRGLLLCSNVTSYDTPDYNLLLLLLLLQWNTPSWEHKCYKQQYFYCCVSVQSFVTGYCFPVHVMKTYKAIRGTPLLILSLGKTKELLHNFVKKHGQIFQLSAGLRDRCRVCSSLCHIPTSWYFVFYAQSWGTPWRSWLKHFATSWKVAGSISDGATGIFSLA